MTHVHEDIGAYVLGGAGRRMPSGACASTSPSARSARPAHAELAGIPGLLDLAVVTGATRRGAAPARDRGAAAGPLRARARAEPPRRAARWRPRLALGVAERARRRGDRRRRAVVLGSNFQKNAGRPPSQYRLAFEPIGPAPANASARAGLRTTESGTVVRLWVNNLPGDPATSTRSSATRKGWSASAGTFRVDAKGNALRDPHDRGQDAASTTRSASSAAPTWPTARSSPTTSSAPSC